MASCGQNADVFLYGFFCISKVKWKIEAIAYIIQFSKYFIVFCRGNVSYSSKEKKY